MRVSLHSIVYVLIMGTVIIDLITGAMLQNNPDIVSTPGQFYKLLFLIVLLSFTLKINKIALISISILISTTFLSSLVSGITTFPVNLIANIKLLIFLLFFYYLQYTQKINFFNTRTLFKVAKFTLIVIGINQILGLLGLGKPTYYFYGTPVGTSGFFYEHNATGLILIMILSIIYLHLNNRFKFVHNSLFVIFSILIGFSFATKTAMLGSIILSLIVLYEKKPSYIPYLILIFAIFTYIYWDIIQATGQIAKILDDADSRGSDVIFSGRAVRLITGFDDFFFKFNWMDRILGIGNFRMLNDPLVGGTSETDYMDILKMSGIVGFILVYIPFFRITWMLYKKYQQTKQDNFKIVLILNIFFLIISSTAGHLFVSGSVTFYLALLNIYPFMYLNETNIDKQKRDVNYEIH